jgi:hypothetical protein
MQLVSVQRGEVGWQHEVIEVGALGGRDDASPEEANITQDIGRLGGIIGVEPKCCLFRGKQVVENFLSPQRGVIR